jgi:MFS family permease
MVNKINLKEMEKKSWRYSIQDGLIEVSLGILLVVLGLLLSIEFTIGFIVVFFIIFMNPLLEIVRKKYTYPRIGRVKVHEDEPKKTMVGIFLYLITVAMIMGIAMFVIFGEINAENIYKSLPIFYSIMILGAMLYSYGKSESQRFYLYAVLALLTAPVFSYINFEGRLANIGYYLLFIGFIFLIIGLIIFIHFLIKYPFYREEIIDDN